MLDVGPVRPQKAAKLRCVTSEREARDAGPVWVHGERQIYEYRLWSITPELSKQRSRDDQQIEDHGLLEPHRQRAGAEAKGSP